MDCSHDPKSMIQCIQDLQALKFYPFIEILSQQPTGHLLPDADRIVDARMEKEMRGVCGCARGKETYRFVVRGKLRSAGWSCHSVISSKMSCMNHKNDLHTRLRVPEDYQCRMQVSR